MLSSHCRHDHVGTGTHLANSHDALAGCVRLQEEYEFSEFHGNEGRGNVRSFFLNDGFSDFPLMRLYFH